MCRFRIGEKNRSWEDPVFLLFNLAAAARVGVLSFFAATVMSGDSSLLIFLRQPCCGKSIDWGV